MFGACATGAPATTADLVCLDTSVWIALLTPEDASQAAQAAAEPLLSSASCHLVAPSRQWVEVQSVLRQKVRRGQLRDEEAVEACDSFAAFPVHWHDGPRLRHRTWALATAFGLGTADDACLLACTETAGVPGDARLFLTLDKALVRALGDAPPPYVRLVP